MKSPTNYKAGNFSNSWNYGYKQYSQKNVPVFTLEFFALT